MVKYQLLWSGYIQWTRTFDSDQQAIDWAKDSIKALVGTERISEFVLLKMQQIPLS